MTFQDNDESLKDKGNSIQNQGNSIRSFKTKYEKKHEKEISKQAEDYLKNRYSILKSGTEPKEINTSIISNSKKEIINNALKIVCENLRVQTAAIFIVSKDGHLVRIGIYGRNKKGQYLKNNWFSNEFYNIDEGFTGKVVKKSSSYGEVQYTSNISKELDADYKREYLEQFGNLHCSVAVPLNGRNRACGVLRVINKLDERGIPSSERFTESDISLLLFLTSNIANALSNFRREMQVEMLKKMSHSLIQTLDHKEDSLKSIYHDFLDLLVNNPETIFKAGILKIKDDISESLIVKAKSLASGVSDNRDDGPRERSNTEFLWITVSQKKRLIIQEDLQLLLKKTDKDKKPITFKNSDWIIDNGFRSVAGFPLVVKEDTVGSLCLYSKLKIDPDSIDFVQGVVDLLASFIFYAQLEKRERELQEALLPKSLKSNVEEKFNRLAEEWRSETKFFSSIYQMSVHPAYQQIIGLGPDVIPILLRELIQREEAEHWFWALSAISGENPLKSQQEGNLELMKKAWIEWGKSKKYV